MSANYYDLLKYAATGQASPDMTYYDRMRASTIMGGAVQTLTGIPPLSFKSNGKPLISLSMLGNTQQNGTTSPQSIIMPTFCGKLVGTDWTIPITNAGQTTPVYLSKVQTVRKARKRALMGNENWVGNDGDYYADGVTDYLHADYTVFCTHFPTSPNVATRASAAENSLCFGKGILNRIFFKWDLFATVNDLIGYLAAQYAAGTPVTVWYVLATPETGIVNEPLAKIGDYADELNITNEVTIPTVKGNNTLTVDSDLPPSEMTITYKE